MITIFKDFLIAILVFIIELSKYIYRHCNIRHVFSISGLLKIAFLYCAVVGWIIVFDFTLPKTIDRTGTTIAIYCSEDRIGEMRLYDRTVTAAKSMGWNVIGGTFSELWVSFALAKPFYYSAASLINLIFQPKFNLAVTHFAYLVPLGYNIVYLNVPNDSLFDLYGEFKDKYKHLSQYDAYIDLYSVMNGTNPTLINALEKCNKSDAPIIPLYLAQNYIEYTAAKREQALVVGSLWGCNRNSMRMMHALQHLVKDDLLVGYGLKELDALGTGYKGRVEDFAPEISSMEKKLVQLQKQYGISIVIHTLEHLISGMPTSRISESVAAGAIVISDQNAFIKHFFGDNVLYIDAITSADKIYSQIKDHIDWIKNHPAESEIKAKNAYDIFVKDLLLEKQLQKLLDAVTSRKA